MFNPTKAHNKEIKNNQYKIRIGSRVPEDAVSLAYTYITPLNPAKNVQIADTSGFVLENISSEGQTDVMLWPDDTYLLRNNNGNPYINAKNFLMTNVFASGEPLYYAYELEYMTIDSEGPDEHGFYKGNTISVIDRLGKPIGGDYKYEVMLTPTSYTNIYRVLLFTNFQTQPSDMIKVIYTAVQSDLATPVSTPGYTELITPQPAFRRKFDMNDVIGKGYGNLFYYQANGKDLGQSQVYAPQIPLQNSKYRSPVLFDYKITVTYTDGTTASTSLISDNVYNENSVTEADKYYHNGFKRLQNKTAAEIAADHISITNASSYAVSSTSLDVELYTQPDGQNYVLASTTVDTGYIVLPRDYRIEERDNDIFYAPTYSARLTDNDQIHVLSPREKTSDENWYARINNGRFKRAATNDAGFPIRYQYALPEYYTQEFDKVLGMPFKTVKDERPEIVGDRKIKVRYTPLYVFTIQDDVSITVMVNGLKAKVKKWDINDGTIELDTKIKQNDNVRVTYIYEEHSFTYRGYWDEKNQKFWYLDLNPSDGHMYTNINEDTGEIIDVPSFGLINKTVYLYIKPNASFSDNGLMIQGSYASRTLFHTFKEIDDPTSDAILLAKIQVRPNSSMESIQLIDTRVRGGGLKEHIGKELIKELSPESEFYWDIGYWDGEPYSENGVAIVRLPVYILKDRGGKFTRPEVEAIVHKHLGFGNLPIIEYIEEPRHLLSSPWGASLDIITLDEGS